MSLQIYQQTYRDICTQTYTDRHVETNDGYQQKAIWEKNEAYCTLGTVYTVNNIQTIQT